MITGSPLGNDEISNEIAETIILPRVIKIDSEKYSSFDKDIPFDQMLQQRSDIILNIVKKFKPHLMLVDHSPLGMKQELLPALRWLKKENQETKIILGLRDILDDADHVHRVWLEEKVYDALTDLYDFIFIYGNQEFYDPTEEYQFPPAVRAKTRFVGYIADPVNTRRSDLSNRAGDSEKKSILVTIGGGEWMGDTIIGTYLKMLFEFQESFDFRSVIVTGPFIPEQLWKRFKDAAADLPVEIYKFSPDLNRFYEISDLVIATGGYNTIGDILSYGRKALIIPRVKFRREQQIRAQRLSSWNMCRILNSAEINPTGLYSEIIRMLNDNNMEKEISRGIARIGLNGTENLIRYIGKILSVIDNEEVKN
jgi:predicted glycosyltransferase